jgi:uncharacterized protein
MHNSVAKHTNEIIALCKKYGVLRLEVFGSAARGVDFDEERSDVDLIAQFDKKHKKFTLSDFFGFAEELEKIIDRKVDLSEDVAIKNPYLRQAINSSRELVYAA